MVHLRIVAPPEGPRPRSTRSSRAGLLSLTTAKSGALIGVLVSVTTIPAAANVGVAAAYADRSSFHGSLGQLPTNVAALLVACGVSARQPGGTQRGGRW